MAHANYTVSTSTSTESSGDSVNAGTIASSVILIISPDIGYTVSASDFFIGDPLPVEVASVVFTNTTNAGQYGNLVHATVIFNHFIMPSSNKEVVVDIDGVAREIVSVDPDINVCITDNVQSEGFCPDTSWPNQGDPTEPGGGGGPDNTNPQCLSQFVTTVEGTGITAVNGTNTNWYNSLINSTDIAYTTQHSGGITPSVSMVLFTKTFWTSPQTSYHITPTYSLNAAASASGYYTVQETPTSYSVDKTLTANVSNSNVLTCDTTDVLPGMQVTGVDLLSCGDNMGTIAATVGGCYPWSMSDIRVVSVDHTAGTITITEEIVSLAIGDVLNFSTTLNLVSPNGLGAAPNNCLVKQFTVSFNGDTDVSCDAAGTGCEDGMDVAFIFDYTASMEPYITSIRNDVPAIVTQIETLMTNSSGVIADYQLSLTLADEAKVGTSGNPPNYVVDFVTGIPHPAYDSLSAAQKYIGTSTPNCTGEYNLMQYITNMESFGLNNSATFTAQLEETYDSTDATTMPIGNGVGFQEPTDIAIDKIANQAFGGSWRSNVAKYIILFTDNLPSGNDDCFNADDAAAMVTLTASLVAAGIKVMVVGAGVVIQSQWGNPWQGLCNATGGIWDEAANGDYAQAVIDNLASMCGSGSSSSSSTQSTSAHEIDFNNSSGPWNWNAGASPKITQIDLDTSNVSPSGEVRKLTVAGNSGVNFNTWLLDEDGRSYDFDTDTFTVASTFLNSQEIDSTGIFTRNIVFPAIAKSTKTYDFTLSPTGGINDGNVNTQPTLAPGVSGEISLSSYTDTTLTLSSFSDTGLGISSSITPSNTITAEGNKVINAPSRTWVDTVTKSSAIIYYNDNHTPASGTTESDIDGDFEYKPGRYSAEASLQAAFTGSGTASITSTVSGRIIKTPTANTTLDLDYTNTITTTPNCYDSSFSLSLEDLATANVAALQVHRFTEGLGGISRGFKDGDANFDTTIPLMTGHKDFLVVDASGLMFGTIGSNSASFNDNYFYGNSGGTQSGSTEVDQILYLYSGGAIVGNTETFTYKCNDGTTDSATKTCIITFIE